MKTTPKGKRYGPIYINVTPKSCIGKIRK